MCRRCPFIGSIVKSHGFILFHRAIVGGAAFHELVMAAVFRRDPAHGQGEVTLNGVASRQ